MSRRLAALLTCALIAFGQRSKPDSPAPAAAPDPWVVDALALDADGRPVTDLSAADFELVQGGRSRKITNFTWFDTRLHVAITRPAQLEALALLPDEIGRNLVVVVDDLGLSPADIDSVCATLKAFLADSMSSGDRMAILRGSEGSGVLQQLTGDKRILLDAIDGIRYLGGATSAAGAGGASWLTLVYALQGLRDFPGRKVVVLFSENPALIGPPPGTDVAEVASAAHAAAASVYALNPLSSAPGVTTAAPGALESLARDTGGWFGGDFAQVLRNEQGYYAMGFQPEEDNSVDLSGSRPPATFAQLKILRPGVVVRSRAGYISHRPRVEFPAPVEHRVLLNTALRSPFAAPDIRVRLTALFSAFSKDGPTVDLAVLLDPHDFSFIHDSEDKYHGAGHLGIAAYRDDGRATILAERNYQVNFLPAEYRDWLEYGLSFPFLMKLPGPGAWQIRVVVADSASDRFGSATRFVQIPNVPQGGLALSGLSLGGAPPGDNAPPDPRADPAVRVFKPGQRCVYRSTVFNPLTGPDKQSALQVQSRIFAAGRVVMDGKPERVTFGEAQDGSRRQISGPIRLDPLMAPGDYVLKVIVQDLLAPPGEPRTATQFIDFQVRE